MVLLPVDADASARRLRQDIRERTGVELAVIISDTFGRPWREGLTNVAIGIAGMEPFKDYRGLPDTEGRILKVTTLAVVDELASAAELVMGKLDRVPVALIRGYPYTPGDGTATQLARARKRPVSVTRGETVKIAILGGTGEQGPGLALRWAMAGEEVIIGSRSQERAEKVAAELNAELGQARIRGLENPQAAEAAEIIVLTVPYTAHLSTLESVKTQVQGKIFVDVSVPSTPKIHAV